ncbi:nucleotidyltransferase family protein [Aureimonas psammosilenae]|uniref:nucleotidyltransferase family protein n=1 Tax=Aureimonas psammosilenae TaxID=2495496 RepID=UPI002E252605
MRTRIEVLLLAAGRSSRTGDAHKLLASFDGEPLLRRMARISCEAGASGVSVVVGHRAEEMRSALAGLPVKVVYNGRFGEGLSTSLVAGFAAAAENSEGVLVMLADQPMLTSFHLGSLMDAFSPTGHGSIVAATDNGKRFNPVIISSIYRAQIVRLTGDLGARSVVAAHPEAVREIEIGRAASLDVDTPEAIAAAGGQLRP